jgi:hypothetical protein
MQNVERGQRCEQRLEKHLRDAQGKSVRFLARRYGRALDGFLSTPERLMSLEMPPAQFFAVTMVLDMLRDGSDEALRGVRETLRQIDEEPVPENLPRTFKVEDTPLYLLVFLWLDTISKEGRTV